VLIVDEPALDRDERLAEDEASEIAWTKVSNAALYVRCLEKFCM
jgi:hypothetical protein